MLSRLVISATACTLTFAPALLGDCSKDREDGVAPSTAAAPPAPAASPEQSALAEAQQLCAVGDCQTAHERLAVALPATSPVRSSAEYRDLENRWAASTIAGATNDPDVMARRRALTAVMQSTVVDPGLRAQAKATLATLPSAPPPPISLAPAKSDLAVAQELSKTDPQKAKELLANKVVLHAASPEETAFLVALCKKTKDKECLTMLKVKPR